MDFAFVGTHSENAWKDEDHWQRENIEVTKTGVRLQRTVRSTFVSPAPALIGVTSEVRAVDIDIDQCGHLYILDVEGDLYRYDPDRQSLDALECDDSQVIGADGTEPRALCVTTHTIYVAEHLPGDDDPSDDRGRLIALSKHLLQPRWIAEKGYRSPRGMASHGDAVYLVDGGSESAGTSDSFLARVRAGGEPDPLVSGLDSPRDVATDYAGTVYVLLENSVWTWSEEHGEGTISVPDAIDPLCLETVSTEKPDDTGNDEGPDETIDEGDLLFGVSSKTPGEKTLYRYVHASGGWSLERVPSFTGECRRLRSWRGRGLYLIDEKTEQVMFLTEVSQYQRNLTTGRYNGQVWRRLDAGEFGMKWHRTTLGFEVTDPGTQVRLEYYATDDSHLTLDPASREWRPLDRPNPPDAFLPDAIGRYLWVKLDIVGTADASPTVSAFRAYFPRQSYLRYLPAISQEDERFLSIFESIFVDIEEEIESTTKFIDPYGIPPRYLPWLGEWLAIAVDETWSHTAIRKLIQEAPALFKKRGTKAGLLAVFDIFFTDGAVAPSSEESNVAIPNGRCCPDDVEDDSGPLQEPSTRPSSRSQSVAFLLEDADLDCIDDDEVRAEYRKFLSCPQCFFVFLQHFVDDDDVRAVERIVEAGAPAHAIGRTVRLQPWIQLGGHSYLGVNSALTDPEFVLEDALIGTDSVLGEREPYGQLGFRSRLDGDASLS
jgi:phage tail-like protein